MRHARPALRRTRRLRVASAVALAGLLLSSAACTPILRRPTFP